MISALSVRGENLKLYLYHLTALRMSVTGVIASYFEKELEISPILTAALSPARQKSF